ncbi:alkene reductase [Lentzea sp. NPDC004782]|uniref:oxidoreductase n=1 Tax=Lentzea sp. NPDC004782 TaxID=3154458 RepID=UPI0033BE0DD2
MDSGAAFLPVVVGGVTLKNRLAMAPMTLSQATEDGVLLPGHVNHYRARAGAGLIVTEAAQISRRGQSYPNTPGIHTLQQAVAWEQVTRAVHEGGGVIYLQLFHGGRVGHPSVRGGLVGHAPSAVAATGPALTKEGPVEHTVPAAMTTAEIKETIREFGRSARLAISAGFDGVQLHAGNGYLPQQFLCRTGNLRTDEWGGSTTNRIRFVVETSRAIAEAVGPERTAVRIAPGAVDHGLDEAGTEELYAALLDELNDDGLAFLDVIEALGTRDRTISLRSAWGGVLVVNPHRDESVVSPHERVADALTDGADVVALGLPWLANPDLDRRIATGGPYEEFDGPHF